MPTSFSGSTSFCNPTMIFSTNRGTTQYFPPFNQIWTTSSNFNEHTPSRQIWTPQPSVAKVLSGAMYSFRSSGFPQIPSAVRSLPREKSHGLPFVAEKAWKRAGLPRKHEENHGKNLSFWSNNPNTYITLRIWPGKQPWETPKATWPFVMLCVTSYPLHIPMSAVQRELTECLRPM